MMLKKLIDFVKIRFKSLICIILVARLNLILLVKPIMYSPRLILKYDRFFQGSLFAKKRNQEDKTCDDC